MVLVVEGENFFVGPPNDLVAQSRSNNLGRSYNSKNFDIKKFFSCDQLIPRKPPKRFKLQI